MVFVFDIIYTSLFITKERDFVHTFPS